MRFMFQLQLAKEAFKALLPRITYTATPLLLSTAPTQMSLQRSNELGQPSRSSDTRSNIRSSNNTFQHQTSLAQASPAGVPFLCTGRCPHTAPRSTPRGFGCHRPPCLLQLSLIHFWQITCRNTYLRLSFFSRLSPVLISGGPPATVKYASGAETTGLSASFCFQPVAPPKHTKEQGTWTSQAVDRLLYQHQEFQTRWPKPSKLAHSLFSGRRSSGPHPEALDATGPHALGGSVLFSFQADHLPQHFTLFGAESWSRFFSASLCPQAGVPLQHTRKQESWTSQRSLGSCSSIRNPRP